MLVKILSVEESDAYFHDVVAGAVLRCEDRHVIEWDDDLFHVDGTVVEVPPVGNAEFTVGDSVCFFAAKIEIISK